jgi:hypothetical protein
MGLEIDQVEHRRLVFWMLYKSDAWQVRVFYVVSK